MNLSINNSLIFESDQTLLPDKFIILFILIGLIGLGTTGALGSATVAWVIFRSKTMRSSCFELIAVGAIGSFLVAIYHVINGIYAIFYIAELTDLSRPRWQCCLINIIGLWAIPFHSLLICFVGFDRLISSVAPIRHRRLNKNYVIYVAIGCMIFVTGQSIAALAPISLYDLIECKTIDDLASQTFMRIYGALNISYYLISVMTYLAILITFSWQTHKVQSMNLESHQQSAAVIPSIKLMIVLYFIFGLTGELFVNIFLRLKKKNQIIYSMWACGVNLKVASSLVEIIALMKKSSKFRECFRKCFGLRLVERGDLEMTDRTNRTRR